MTLSLKLMLDRVVGIAKFAISNGGIATAGAIGAVAIFALPSFSIAGHDHNSHYHDVTEASLQDDEFAPSDSVPLDPELLKLGASFKDPCTELVAGELQVMIPKPAAVEMWVCSAQSEDEYLLSVTFEGGGVVEFGIATAGPQLISDEDLIDLGSGVRANRAASRASESITTADAYYEALGSRGGSSP